MERTIVACESGAKDGFIKLAELIDKHKADKSDIHKICKEQKRRGDE